MLKSYTEIWLSEKQITQYDLEVISKTFKRKLLDEYILLKGNSSQQNY